MFRYPWELLPRLGSDIELHLKEAAHRDLDELLEIISKQNNRGLSRCKLRCSAASSYCSRGALQGGASSNKILKSHFEFLEKLAAARSWKQVCLLMHRYVDVLLRRVRPVRGGSMEQTVAHIRTIMRQSLSSAPSLFQHAITFGVSASHLSRCFSAIVGRTFQQETRRLRIEHALYLLTETNFKIATIADEVGVPDASRFILEFRKELGVTPGEYRKIRGAPDVKLSSISQ